MPGVHQVQAPEYKEEETRGQPGRWPAHLLGGGPRAQVAWLHQNHGVEWFRLPLLERDPWVQLPGLLACSVGDCCETENKGGARTARHSSLTTRLVRRLGTGVGSRFPSHCGPCVRHSSTWLHSSALQYHSAPGDWKRNDTTWTPGAEETMTINQHTASGPSTLTRLSL